MPKAAKIAAKNRRTTKAQGGRESAPEQRRAAGTSVLEEDDTAVGFGRRGEVPTLEPEEGATDDFDRFDVDGYRSLQLE